MKKIFFVCSAGMSTSLLVSKTRQAIKERGLTIEIASQSETEARAKLTECSAILLGPQVKFLLEEMREVAEPYQVRVDMINPITYGRMDGSAMVDQILEMFGHE